MYLHRTIHLQFVSPYEQFQSILTMTRPVNKFFKISGYPNKNLLISKRHSTGLPNGQNYAVRITTSIYNVFQNPMSRV